MLKQSATLKISGVGVQTADFTEEDLAQMPTSSVDVSDPHRDQMQHYQGVALSDLLAKVGIPLGEKLRGKAMAMYVVTKASDGYAAVYSRLRQVTARGPNGSNHRTLHPHLR